MKAKELRRLIESIADDAEIVFVVDEKPLGKYVCWNYSPTGDGIVLNFAQGLLDSESATKWLKEVAAARQKQAKDTCVWRPDVHRSFGKNTECGNYFVKGEDFSPSEEGMKFCCYCGKFLE